MYKRLLRRFLSLLIAGTMLFTVCYACAEGGDLVWITSDEAADEEPASFEETPDGQADELPAFEETAVSVEMTAPLEWTYPVPPTDLQSDYVRLANKASLLESDYAPKDLVKIKAKKTSSTAIQMRQAASDALSDMFEAALAEGITLYAHSGYRSYGTQKTMYNNRLNNHGGVDDGYVAKPGASDHQTGLGIDVISKAWIGKKFNGDFANTVEAQWMEAHCFQYGFVIRYPKDKVAITEIEYEPWHLRYVGLATAAYMTSHQLTLEEFTDEYKPILEAFLQSGGEVDNIPSELGQIDELIALAQKETDLGMYRTEIMSSDGEYEYSLFAPESDFSDEQPQGLR